MLPRHFGTTILGAEPSPEAEAAEAARLADLRRRWDQAWAVAVDVALARWQEGVPVQTVLRDAVAKADELPARDGDRLLAELARRMASSDAPGRGRGAPGHGPTVQRLALDLLALFRVDGAALSKPGEAASAFDRVAELLAGHRLPVPAETVRAWHEAARRNPISQG